MDNIFRVVRLVRQECPIQRSDRIHVSQFPVQLYCCHLSFDLYVLNQSKCPRSQHSRGEHEHDQKQDTKRKENKQ